MKNWNSLKTAITDVIRTNGNQEITGANLQSTLLTMVNSLGANRTFAGLANPSTKPGAPEGPVFYIASMAGTYANFGNIVVNSNALTLLVNDENSWVALPIAIPTSGNSGQGLTDLEVSADFAELDQVYGYEAAGIYKVTIADYPDTQPNYLLVVLSTIDNSSCTQFLFGNFEIFEGGILEYTDAPVMGPTIAVRTGSGAFSAGWSYLYQDSLVTLNTMLKGDISMASAYATELNSLYGDDKAGLYRIVASTDGAVMGMLLVVVTENFTQQYLLGSFEIFEDGINISAAEPAVGTPTFATRYRASSVSAFSPWSYLYQDLLIKTGNPEYTPMHYDAAKIFALTTGSNAATVKEAFTPLNYSEPTAPKPGDYLGYDSHQGAFLVTSTTKVENNITICCTRISDRTALFVNVLAVNLETWSLRWPISESLIDLQGIPFVISLAPLITGEIGTDSGLSSKETGAYMLIGTGSVDDNYYNVPVSTATVDGVCYLYFDIDDITIKVGVSMSNFTIVSREYLRSKGALKYELSKLMALTTNSSEDNIKKAFTPVNSAFAIMPAPGDIIISDVTYDGSVVGEDQNWLVASADYTKTSRLETVTIRCQSATSTGLSLRYITVYPDFSRVTTQGLASDNVKLAVSQRSYNNIDALTVDSTADEIQTAFKPNGETAYRKPEPGDKIFLGYNSTYKNQYYGTVLYVEDDYTVQEASKYIITYTAAEGNIHKIAVKTDFSQVYYKYGPIPGLQTGSRIYAGGSATVEIFAVLVSGGDLSTITYDQIVEFCTTVQGTISIPRTGDIIILSANEEKTFFNIFAHATTYLIDNRAGSIMSLMIDGKLYSIGILDDFSKMLSMATA